ncbi:cytochrome P450 [Ramaria rubella]|nr:cytochrome P450 [Ramaria rubella]
MGILYYFAAVFVSFFLFVAHRVIRRLRMHSIAYLPGPPKAGLLALQYILNTGGYNFPKTQQNAATSRLITGEGISFARASCWVAGEQHVRHRKIMNPAFSYTTLRIFLPLFRDTAQKLQPSLIYWQDLVTRNGGGPSVIDVPSWLGRMTLDAMGTTAFDYDFGALDGSENELSKMFGNLTVDAFYKRPDFVLLLEHLWGFLPWSTRLAKKVVDTQTSNHQAGRETGKDVMSILIRANMSEDPKTRLSEEELKAQLTTLMFAGYETSASTVAWGLYELSRHPKFQDQIREEIKQTRIQAAQRGDGELTVADLDSMKYLLAFMKETLRFHPIITLLIREAARDDVIPLSAPQKTRNGGTVSSIPVSKRQRILISIAAYNRLKSVWGDDADVYKPERFLDAAGFNHKTVLSNLATFSSGVRSCIGMIEMQAILIELIEHFEFSPAPGNPMIIRGATAFMAPM